MPSSEESFAGRLARDTEEARRREDERLAILRERERLAEERRASEEAARLQEAIEMQPAFEAATKQLIEALNTAEWPDGDWLEVVAKRGWFKTTYKKLVAVPLRYMDWTWDSCSPPCDRIPGACEDHQPYEKEFIDCYLASDGQFYSKNGDLKLEQGYTVRRFNAILVRLSDGA